MVARLAEIERRLLALDAGLVQARTHELNLRFDTSQGALAQAGHVLRLRRDDSVRLTYKDSGRQESGALSRQEIEFVASDFDLARDFLMALGYQIVFVYEKYRTTYALEDVEFMLDELPYGDFVEIEGEVADLRSAAKRLGLDWATAISRSYHDIFQQVRNEQSLPFRDLTFENFAGISPRPTELGVQLADA